MGMMAAPTTLITAEELAEIPDDGYQYELIEGVVRRRPFASFRASSLAARIITSIGTYAVHHRLGEMTGANPRARS